MATRWFWWKESGEQGPISFQVLVSMIRDCSLNEDDLVRPDYRKEWQTTNTVVGLYYMAKRVPVPRVDLSRIDSETDFAIDGTDLLRGENQEHSHKIDDASHDLVPSESIGTAAVADEGEYGLEEKLDAADSHEDTSNAASPPSVLNEMVAAIDVATEDWDRRHVLPITKDVRGRESIWSVGLFFWAITCPWRWTLAFFSLIGSLIGICVSQCLSRLRFIARFFRLQQLCLLLEGIASRQTFSQWFRVVCALVAAGVVTYSVISWSNYTDLRFPDAKKTEAGLITFPIYGPCPPDEYAFILINVALVALVAGYLGARVLESMADE